MTKESQNRQILAALENGQRLTAIDILYQFQSLRASGRIFDLRQQGHDIKTQMISLGNGKRVAQYSMKPKKQFS
jgi:hypothetical protein